MRNLEICRRAGLILSLAIAGVAHPAFPSEVPPSGGKATLVDLAWMAGHWEGQSGSTSMEEIWTEPRGGVILGLHRDVTASGKAMFEYLRIVEDGEGIAYLASPGGRPPTRFPLLSASGKRAVFENPDHDFPQRIIYWLGEDGLLHARVEGDQGGKPGAMEWAWSRRN